MTSTLGGDAEEVGTSKRSVRILQSIGAIIATCFVLWFLFGVPAYLLFGLLFE